MDDALLLDAPATTASTGTTSTTATPSQEREMRVAAMRHEATDVLSLELRPLDGGALPSSTAGAHVELLLPGGLRRAYSLINAPGERDVMRVAVHRSDTSRGGSRAVHEALRPGQRLRVSAPRNHFALVQDDAPVVLIAGGIGITPLYAMAQQLAAQGRPWTLHYAARTADRAAFVDALRALAARSGSEVHLYFNAEPGGRALDVDAVVAHCSAQAHLYCCGPQGLLQTFEQAAAGRDPRRVHLERFAAASPPGGPENAAAGFDVVLRRSGRTLRIEPDTTILAQCLAAGIDAPHSCREGFCGTCETAVLDGEPAHADSVLSADERAAGRSMMICCSRSRSAALVLDL
jgi:vanillate O-demethylase ferredoxin subunit